MEANKPLDVAIRQGANTVILLAFEIPPHLAVDSAGIFTMQMFSVLVNQWLNIGKFAHHEREK